MVYECINEDCGWVGDYVDTVCFKHDILLEEKSVYCPDCHEVAEKREENIL